MLKTSKIKLSFYVFQAKLMEMVEAEMNNNSKQMIDNQKNIYQQWNLDRDLELKK
jgi:hypothetical protein